MVQGLLPSPVATLALVQLHPPPGLNSGGRRVRYLQPELEGVVAGANRSAPLSGSKARNLSSSDCKSERIWVDAEQGMA